MINLKHFDYDHLSEPMRSVSKEFHDIAHGMSTYLGACDPDEVEAGLRKLLEAKDCFVRASLERRRDQA